MYYKPTKVIKIVGAIFEKIEMFEYLCELPLIFKAGRKRKNRLEIFAREL